MIPLEQLPIRRVDDSTVEGEDLKARILDLEAQLETQGEIKSYKLFPF